jgi:hypothetical protein
MAEEKVRKFTNGEIPHLVGLSDTRIVSFKKERIQYKSDLGAVNRNNTGNTRTENYIAQCIDANLLNEIKEELELEENISDLDSALTA